MNLIIRKAKIIDATSPFHNEIVDMILEAGHFTEIGTNLLNLKNYREITLKNLHISQGWFDSSVSMGEPGFEDRETIINGLNVASKSGFTSVAMQPCTFPVIDNQTTVTFIKNKSNASATTLYPIGALTKGSDGKDLAELLDMKNAGAIAFGDYNRALHNSNMLKIGLQYVQNFDGLVIAYAQDEHIKGNGVAHEGTVSTKLGLKGIPALAEALHIARNLLILEYTGGRLHIPTLSTTKSVSLVKAAKAKGLQVTCSVSVHHLVLTDETLSEFDTRYKVTPPLRDEATRIALLEAVKEGTIDMITSDHNPIAIEDKKVEFDRAKNGTIGLESAFSALLTVLPLETIIEKLTSGKNTFKISQHPIAIGHKADISLFNPEGNWFFEKENILSKSKNTAFLKIPMQGHVYGIYNNNYLILK